MHHARSDMDRAIAQRQGCFAHGFRQRRMRVGGAGQIFGRAREFHQRHQLVEDEVDHPKRRGEEDRPYRL